MKKDCPDLEDSGKETQGKKSKFKSFMGKKVVKTQDWAGMSRRVIRESHGLHLHMCGDSGASFHVTSKKHLIQDYETLSEPIQMEVGDGKHVLVTGKGSMKVEVFDGEHWNPGLLSDVMYCKSLGQTDLFSLSAVSRKYRVLIEKDLLVIQELGGGECFLTGYREEDDLFTLLIRLPVSSHRALVSKKRSLQTWHERLGHISPATIKTMIGSGCVNGLEVGNCDEFFCDPCVRAKMTRLAFQSPGTKERL